MRNPDREATLSPSERIAIALVFLVAIGVAAVVVARLGAPDGVVVGPPDERPMVSDSVARPVPLIDGFEVAHEWAREWDRDAWLILVSTQFEYLVEDGEVAPEADQGMFIFTFAAPKEGDTWSRLTLAVSRQSGVIYFEDEFESEVEPPDSIEALLRDLPVTAEQAFRLAEEVVGATYRDGCEQHRRAVQVILDTTDRDNPTWVAVYYDQRERNTNDIVMRIDAITGATTSEERDDTSCDMDAS
jgi:hypothetical protein